MGVYVPGGGGGASFPLTNTAPAATTVEYQTNVTGDTNQRFQITADGTENWLPGNSPTPKAILQPDANGNIVLYPKSGFGPGSGYGFVIGMGGNNNPNAYFLRTMQNSGVFEVQYTNGTVLLQISVYGDMFFGTGALPTNANAGFGVALRTMPGAPTTAPGANQTGQVPIVYDTTNHKLWVYDAGWKGVVLA